MSVPDVQLLARDANREIVGVLSGWSLDATLRFNEVGSWTVEIGEADLPVGWPVERCGVVCVRDEQVLFSGEVDDNPYEWSASGETAGGVRTLTGGTELGAIGYRYVYPDPTQSWENQSTQAHYDNTGNAETLLRDLVYFNAGVGAHPGPPHDRRVAGLMLGTLAGVGTDTTVHERFTELLEALRSVAVDGGSLGFDVRDDLGGNLVFSVFSPRDLTGSARFTRQFGNLVSIRHVRQASTGNVALVAGGGELTARDTYEAVQFASVDDWGPRELFIDQRQTTDIAEYEKAIAREFEESAQRESLEAEIVSIPQLRILDDVGLGDMVTVQPRPGELTTDVMREVRFRVDPERGERVSATVGRDITTVYQGWRHRLERRVDNLEKEK